MEWTDNTPPSPLGPAVQQELVMTGRHGRPKTLWTQAHFHFPGTHGWPSSGIRPKCSKHPLFGTNRSSPSLLSFCSIDNSSCAGFITEIYLRETHSSNQFMSMSKLLLDYVPGKGRKLLIISLMGTVINVWFSLERPLIKRPGVSLKLF